MWRNAYKNIPSTLDPADYGWTLTDEELTFKWFEGPETPENINEIVLSGENEQESSTDPRSGSQEPENFNDEIDRNDYLNQGDEDDDDDDYDDDDDEAESDDCADLDYNETYEDSCDD
ncbi:hypothetical protein WA026_019975 [Henosepilachna vigintioctopunctata]|uniref:Uncharacterized protein n=1 Tax=Henosepilachna vigintioctopunctata TaxID=420089 RepID=A0AAW1UU69_9CUCU